MNAISPIIITRNFSSSPIHLSEQQQQKRTDKDLARTLLLSFDDEPNSNFRPLIKVNDISGGCGAMFDILVVSKKFEGISVVKQHKMVMDILKKDIKNMHGLTINTKTPTQYLKLQQSK